MAFDRFDASRFNDKDSVDAIGELMDLMGLYVRTNFYNNIHNYIDTKNLDDGGIKGGSRILMDYLYRCDHPVSVSHLSNRLMVNNVSRFINKLEEKRFIERNFCKADKRVVEISITEKGRKAMSGYYESYSAAAKEFMQEVFDAEQLEDMKNTLLKLIGMLSDMPTRIEESEKILLEMRNIKVDIDNEVDLTRIVK